MCPGEMKPRAALDIEQVLSVPDPQECVGKDTVLLLEMLIQLSLSYLVDEGSKPVSNVAVFASREMLNLFTLGRVSASVWLLLQGPDAGKLLQHLAAVSASRRLYEVALKLPLDLNGMSFQIGCAAWYSASFPVTFD